MLRRFLPQLQQKKLVIVKYINQTTETAKQLPIATARYSGNILGEFASSFAGRIFRPLGNVVYRVGNITNDVVSAGATILTGTLLCGLIGIVAGGVNQNKLRKEREEKMKNE